MLHCHANGFIHHDLKPDNILVKRNSNGVITSVKVADFGLSRSIQDKLTSIKDACGTPEYSAPEMLIEGKTFDEKIDSWSIGVILFNLLFAKMPFSSNNIRQLMEKIKKEELDFKNDNLQSISIEAADLLDQLLEKKPSLRLSPKEIL